MDKGGQDSKAHDAEIVDDPVLTAEAPMRPAYSLMPLFLAGCFAVVVSDPDPDDDRTPPDDRPDPSDGVDPPREDPADTVDTSAAAWRDTGRAGTPPACAIAEPAEAGGFPVGASIRFTASVQDRDDDVVRILWDSDAYGAMAVGQTFEFILPEGPHDVRLRVEDASGHRCEDHVRIVVGRGS